MKKVLLTTLMFLLCSPLVFAEDITIEVNDEEIIFEEPPIIVEDRTMVPLKFLMDTLGYSVEWFEATRQVVARRDDNELTLTIDDHLMIINGQTIESDVAPMIHNNRTYVPLAIISRATGSDVTWIGETRTVVLKEKLDFVNVYYGRGGYKNYSALKDDNDFVDQMSYAWARIEIDSGEVLLNTSSLNGNDMFYPDGHDLVMDIDAPKLLNIYADGDYEKIFAQSEQVIQAIKKKILSPDQDEPEFDGLVIDFENLGLEWYEKYVAFIKGLDEEMPSIKIDIAIQPRLYDYSLVLPYVDHMILMLHDYESKSEVVISLNQNYVDQPITPIERLRADLEHITQNIESWDRHKILLQLNLSVVQWQGDTLYEVNRFTPGYQKMLDRMKELTFSNFNYDSLSQNPYLQYKDENNKVNTIWYENETSIQEKIKLVFDFDLGGVSLWQIGNLITSNDENLDQYKINIWKKLKENN